MKPVSLNAFPRLLRRRAGAKKLRTSGRLPAVIYGRHAQPQNLEVNSRQMEDLIHHSASENLLVDLTVDQDARPRRLALVQAIQHHPLSRKVLHVDFHEVAENEKVTISVPVETAGEAEGVKTGGGVLEHVLFRVRARGLPRDLPEMITVDVSHLKLGEAIHLGDIKAPPGVEILGDKQIPVLAVAAPRTEEEEAAATEAAATAPGEVEMIKEKKEEGEEAAPAAKGAEKAAAKGAEKAPAKGAEKAPAKGAEKPAAKGAEKAPAKGAESAAKASEKGAEKGPAPAARKK
ncbi:MAG: 50S ribosomal protein L25 [Verrucomicrobiota bacterium]|jgi:large subunit ribosomal protein L25